jgi:DNA-binding NarL/FixJ family response regulator
MTDSPVRVILADDHTIVRGGVRRILESQPGIVVVGEVDSGDAAMEVVQRMVADVLVLDLKMPGRDGIEVLEYVKAHIPSLKVIVLTMHAGREYVARAVQAQADAYLLKDSAVQDLVTAVEQVMIGRSYFSPAIEQQMAELLSGDRPAGPDLQALTDREREVLQLIVRGLTTKEIATKFDISARTVETHRTNLMRKLGVKSVALLTQVAIREGLLDVESQAD